MSDHQGDFEINGREFHYEVIEIHDYDGREWKDSDDIEDRLEEADMVFYVATSADGEEYYRWLGGPFTSMSDVEAAIIDEVDVYESA